MTARARQRLTCGSRSSPPARRRRCMRSSTIGPKALELLVVAGPLEPLLEHDGELPLGEDDVVVDVVDLPARHLGVVREHLVARDGMPFMST